MSEQVARQERGWGGHFCAAQECFFRRNTLLTNGKISVVASTVGNMYRRGEKYPTGIGSERYYETMAFRSDDEDPVYHDADVLRKVELNSNWAISEPGEDIEANEMHEAAVLEIIGRIEAGDL